MKKPIQSFSSKLRKLIKEQIKQVNKDVKASAGKSIALTPTNYSGPGLTHDTGGNTGGPRRAPDQKFVPEVPLPNVYSSAGPIAFWLCGFISVTNGGTGNGCYGFDQFGIWTSPANGNQAQSGCVPWHMGGNCFAAQHTGDFPVVVNTSNGPVTLTAPPEKACAPNCLHS